MKRAYSYIRFSTPEQLKGKSLERQTEAARTYCKLNSLELDTELSLHDLGVSAFRGKNADTGALGSFLKAVHIGQVPKGSYLLIETFDRMSRESAYDAQLTLQNIINAGITVVTLLDGKQYNVSILRTDPLALIYAILLMSRSHEESATKSKRIADAWRRKRDDLQTGKVFTALTPGWIALDRHRKPKLIPDRVKIVRRIFSEMLAGTGNTTIARRLNYDGVPTFGGGAAWTGTYVRNVLRNRSVLGEFQPHKIEHSPATQQRQRVPVGKPIKNYWPPVIDTRTFNRVQTVLDTRPRQPRLTGLKNILAGLARCPDCGELMVRVIKSNDRCWPRLVCGRARLGGGCAFRSVPLVTLEAALAEKAPTLAADIPDTSADLQQQIEALESELETTRRRIVDMATLLTDMPSRTLAARVVQDEAECERLQEEIARLTAQSRYGNARRISDNVSRVRSALQWHATDPSDVAGVNAALRECFEKIVVDIPRRQLELHWRHGPVTWLPYAAS